MFIYFNKLKFDKDKNFTLSFSDDDAIRNKKCFIKKKKIILSLVWTAISDYQTM